MDKKVLLIDKKDSFIARTIVGNLKENGYEVLQENPDMKAISSLQIPDIIFINIDDAIKENQELLVYLKDLALEEEKCVFFSGYSSDIEEVKKKFASSVVGGTFERPLNAKTIASVIDAKIEAASKDLQKKHILVVDDSGTFLRTIKGWLSDKYRVSMVNSAANGISFLTTNKPDLILLDYEMPVCSGPQMLEMIRAEMETSSIPVIFLTSKDDKESVQKVLSLKPQGYLLKNQTPDKIIKSIDDFFLMKKATE